MIEFKNFSKAYKHGELVVSPLNMIVESGEIFGFIGHNGAGKTTTIKCLIGILDFTEGDILIDGISMKQDPLTIKKNIAYIPDNPDLYENLKGIEYLNFIADVYKVSKEDRVNIMTKYSQLFDIQSNLGDRISSYSHGMKQKLVIISALLHRPKLLVMDEPFVGLDPIASLHLKNIMKELCDEGCSIFFSTHVLDVAEKLCHRVGIIKKGKLISVGKVEELKGDKTLEELFMELSAHE